MTTSTDIRAVHKFRIDIGTTTDLVVPADSEFLHAAVTDTTPDGKVDVWFNVPAGSTDFTTRKFWVLATGERFDSDWHDLVFLRTAIDYRRSLVWHVAEEWS